MDKRMPSNNRLATLAAIALTGMLTLALTLGSLETANAQAPPSVPHTISGKAYIGGSVNVPVPNGYIITARVGDTYETQPAAVKNGSFQLNVAPPSANAGAEIKFYLGDIEANETDKWQAFGITSGLRLTFPNCRRRRPGRLCLRRSRRYRLPHRFPRTHPPYPHPRRRPQRQNR